MSSSNRSAGQKRQITLFCFIAGRLARYFRQENLPLLNDTFGEMVYEDKADADAFGRFLCSQPESKHKSMAIVHITFDCSLRDQLEREGLLKEGNLNILGSPGVMISPGACARLNESARFLIEEIVLETDGDDASSLKLPEWAEKCGGVAN